MKRFEDYDPDEQKVMAQFANHMREVVEKRTCNVVRDYVAARDRNSGLCIENLDAAGNPELRVTEEEAFGEFHLFTRHAGGVGLGLDSEKLVGVLDSLSPREREALLLGVGLGMTPAELAESLHVKESSARTQKAKALAKAKRKVVGNGGD